MKLSKRLNAIVQLLTKKDNVIVDVGCDHCLTAINALLNGNTKFAYNIDIKSEPLNKGIENLKKFHLLNKTKNIVNDGLYKIDIAKKIDYCIISGLGGNTIVDIINNSTVKNINSYIVVSNNHDEYIRKYIYKYKYKISNEAVIHENKRFYHLIEFSKNKGITIKNKNDILFGPINLKNKDINFVEYLQYTLKKYKNLYKLSSSSKHKAIVKKIEAIINN
ncbi:MAG: tRNA (adenine(22)-N(1))-methyltransferase TrmK [Mycoplasmataceae bacterium]|jgi:tRNA (adenine22-N1)-methyltransferase|nr:tRNA (adenine(22)-N(1))-methyltransferase TrmK [Mycoplasmataceae bacterium]